MNNSAIAKRVLTLWLPYISDTYSQSSASKLYDAMNDVIALANESEGVFRKPGILSRVQKLQDAMESQPGKLTRFAHRKHTNTEHKQCTSRIRQI